MRGRKTKPIYNEVRKEHFIDETATRRDKAYCVFKSSYPYEQQAGVDLCDLPLDTLQKYVDENLGTGAASSVLLFSILQSYFDWCCRSGYIDNNTLNQVVIDYDAKVKRYLVASPRHLNLILDQSFTPVEENRLDILYRCLIWLAFSGIRQTDVMSVKSRDIHFDTMTIEFGELVYELYREAIPALRAACEAETFVYTGTAPNGTKTNLNRKRNHNEYLFRSFKTEKPRLGTMLQQTFSCTRAHGFDISYNRVYMSGLFYRAYENERAGLPPNFDDEVRYRVEKNAANKDRKALNASAYSARAGLKKEYQQWKRAFT